ncbi:hypothetical protein [Chryseomicrobium excrementi]|nr:hypothetical protein [Chryseomicrobium excrementi]
MTESPFFLVCVDDISFDAEEIGFDAEEITLLAEQTTFDAQ